MHTPKLPLLAPFLHLLPLLLLPSTHGTPPSCRPPGPIVPRPRAVSASHPVVANATTKLTRAIESALEGEIEAGWPVVNTSFSVGVVLWDQERGYDDLEEEDGERQQGRGGEGKGRKKKRGKGGAGAGAGVPVWEYHHLAKTNGHGTKEIGRDSQWLVGSVTKVVSDFILLRSGVDLDGSVVRFLPELGGREQGRGKGIGKEKGKGEGGETRIDWENVTLRQLASQVAGIPPNCEFIFQVFFFSFLIISSSKGQMEKKRESTALGYGGMLTTMLMLVQMGFPNITISRIIS